MALARLRSPPLRAAAPASVRPRRLRAAPPGEGTPRLSVVIVNYRQWRETATLVRQLLRADSARRGAVEVVVVDNHSPAHTLARWLRRRPGVSLRRWNRNRGFARAVNEGIRLSRGQWLLLLNPDMSVGEDFLDGVLGLADRLRAGNPRAGIVGFQLRDDDGALQWSAGCFPTLFQLLAGLARPRPRRKYQRPRTGKRYRVPWVTGCCLLARRDCLHRLGGLDEDFFLYYEDVDLCRRARAQGWTVWYEPGLRAVHHRPLHGRDLSNPLRLFTRHSLLTYTAKHWPDWQFRFLAGIVRLEAWLRKTWSVWRGDPTAAGQFAELQAMAGDLARGRTVLARRRLNRVVRAEEERGAGPPVHRAS